MDYNLKNFSEESRQIIIKAKTLSKECGYGVVEPEVLFVALYNLERTVCDIINNKSNIDIEIANKAIRKCIKSKEFKANKMFEYAKKMKIYDKVKNYMEAIIW